MRPVLFQSEHFHALEVGAEQVPQVQALFDANPAYFELICGRKPLPDEAQTEFVERPPAHLSYGHFWMIGLHDQGGEMVGVSLVVADQVLPGVWHVALFFIAQALHGQGAAAECFRALQAWIKAQGAQWLRLNVMVGNSRAERFWERMGLREVRRREGIQTGGPLTVARVMVLPLAGGTLEQYLDRMERDRPGSPLP
jgi:RimJ/RimL family protein N-acetyltransferase